ncbi:MAG: hypothetical protein H6713_15825 [Myxococcales bacterium]|nr:hypothetical protein [Myxococcales bacterium]
MGARRATGELARPHPLGALDDHARASRLPAQQRGRELGVGPARVEHEPALAAGRDQRARGRARVSGRRPQHVDALEPERAQGGEVRAADGVARVGDEQQPRARADVRERRDQRRE